MLLLLVTWGCGQTRSIQALPPQPVVPVDTTDASLVAAGLARLEVRLKVDGVPLPADVTSLRFRIEEIRFHAVDAGWVGFPSSSGVLAIDGTSATERPILSTRLEPARYDSVEVAFGDLYVEFGSNAGGPLTAGAPPRTARAYSLGVDVGATTSLVITLDPGASIFQDAACRWHFLPFLRIGGAD